MLRRGVLVACFALAGCVAPQGVAPTSGEVGPGSARVDAMDAAFIFSDVCVKTAPGFAKAPAAMQSMPFAQHPETGTYYHKNLDLSIKLMPKRCSMVFRSGDDTMMVGIAMSGAVPAPEIALDPITDGTTAKGPKGTTLTVSPVGNGMFRAVLIAP